MARTVGEWVGKTDDTPVPPRVKTRVVERAERRCQARGCGIKISYGGQVDHVIAATNWNATPEAPHGNRESNLQLLCKNHHTEKTGRDVAEKSKIAQIKKRMGPVKREKSKWPKPPVIEGKKYNPWTRKMEPE